MAVLAAAGTAVTAFLAVALAVLLVVALRVVTTAVVLDVLTREGGASGRGGLATRYQPSRRSLATCRRGFAAKALMAAAVVADVGVHAAARGACSACEVLRDVQFLTSNTILSNWFTS